MLHYSPDWYSNGGLNNGNTIPFEDQTTFNHLNTGLLSYSGPHCTNSVSIIASFDKKKLIVIELIGQDYKQNYLNPDHIKYWGFTVLQNLSMLLQGVSI